MAVSLVITRYENSRILSASYLGRRLRSLRITRIAHPLSVYLLIGFAAISETMGQWCAIDSPTHQTMGWLNAGLALWALLIFLLGLKSVLDSSDWAPPARLGLTFVSSSRPSSQFGAPFAKGLQRGGHALALTLLTLCCGTAGLATYMSDSEHMVPWVFITLATVISAVAEAVGGD